MKPTDTADFVCMCGWVGKEPLRGKEMKRYFLCPDCLLPVHFTTESEKALMKEMQRLIPEQRRLLAEKKRLEHVIKPRSRCRHSVRKG